MEKIIQAGIPASGHIGLTPQTSDKLGGFKVRSGYAPGECFAGVRAG